MSFKISISVIDVPVFSSTEDYFRLARELDVDGIEFVLGYKTYFSFGSWKDLSRVYKIPILSIHQPVAFILKNKWDEFPFKVAQYFQAKYIAHPLNMLSLNHKKARIFFLWLKMMKEKYKIQILIENMPKKFGIFRMNLKLDPSTSSLSKLSKVCKEYGFGFTLDTTHLAIKDPTKAEGYKAIQQYMQNVHLSDFKEGKMHLPLGTGELETQSFLKNLQNYQYDGIVTLEVFGDVDFSWLISKKIFKNIKDFVNFIRKSCQVK